MEIIRPYRVAHTYTQHLDAPPDRVFPLLCPVRECDWVNGWEPRLVITESGVAEQDCIFTIGPAGNEATWVVTLYEPPCRIEFVKVTPGETVGWIAIRLEQKGSAETLAEVTYAYTALSERGRAVVDAFTLDHYEGFMREWEDELNHFLRTGSRLVVAAGA